MSDRATGADGRFRLVLAVVRRTFARYRRPLSIAGAFVAVGQIGRWFSLGAWPPHDTATIWLAGLHLRNGEAVYTGGLSQYLAFLYSPPIAVLAAPLSLLPLPVLATVLLAAQVAALRWIAGSWTTVGLLGWVPFVPRELVTGNVDLLMAAAIYAGVRGLRYGGYADALFAFVKFSPALATRRWREFVVGAGLLLATTLPWLSLWPAWIHVMAASLGTPTDGLPILPRVPVVVLLLALRRPWAQAAAAAFATPAFYFHSWVLLLPAAIIASAGLAIATFGDARPSGR